MSSQSDIATDVLHLDVMRHGETELSHTLRGSTDDALTENGWQQMQQTLRNAVETGQSWDVIFSSPLQRCQRFAQSVAKQLNLDVHCLPDLQEMHFGDWEGQSTQYLYETVPDQLEKFWLQPTEFSPPNAETLAQFDARVTQAIVQMMAYMQENKLKKALVISHGGVIKLFKCKALKLPMNDLLKMTADLAQLNHFCGTRAIDLMYLHIEE
ncbi:histidine phosphatase family protein [Acinetobacter cumulans]|uniref:histidine phosphatase family protein n=1 Tax=Acinetobacter cumulans TaxID=2136182 RepID=UPI00207B2515|nr:histidine phosphatase family protein [Acinetobacter cumulans]